MKEIYHVRLEEPPTVGRYYVVDYAEGNYCILRPVAKETAVRILLEDILPKAPE